MQITMLLTATMVALLVLCDTTRLQYSRQNWLLIDNSGSKKSYYLLPPREDTDRKHMRNYQQPIEENPEQHTDSKDENNRDTKIMTYNNNGVRKQQWHNYPRQLDRLERSKRDFGHSEADEASKDNEIMNYGNDLLDGKTDMKSGEWNDEPSKEMSTLNHLENSLVDDLTPILLLRIRLSILSWKDQLGKNEKRHNFIETDNDDAMDNLKGGKVAESSPLNEMISTIYKLEEDPEIKTIYVTRGRLPSSQQVPDYAASVGGTRGRQRRLPQDEPRVTKRIFSFWSRLQGMTHSGRELEHRRHFHAHPPYPPLDSHGDIVSAETRAALARPPGSPLRWG